MAALLRRLSWLTGRVVRLVRETPRARTIGLTVPGWPGHQSGQHVDVRLPAGQRHPAGRAYRSSAEEGRPGGRRYGPPIEGSDPAAPSRQGEPPVGLSGSVERSYAIASAPEDTYVELTVERGGYVSSYIVDDLREGDELELRGPLGAGFRWDPGHGGPLLLVAAGVGIAPLRSMLRHHRAMQSAVPVRLLYSVPDAGGLLYHEEIMRFATSDEVDVNLTYTHGVPGGWNGYRRRVDAEMLAEVGWPVKERPVAYVSGSLSFVENATALLVAAGHDAERIHAVPTTVGEGTAVAGLLYDLFGQEMTGVGATCAHCGTRSILARTRVFRGPGTVLLCPACGGRMLVIVERDGVACVDAPGFATLAVRLPRPVSLR